MEIARTQDTGTLQYEISFNDIHGELLGGASAEPRANMTDGPVRLFTPFLSM